MTTKILALTDALGNLVRFVLLPGHRFDTVGVAPLIDGRISSANSKSSNALQCERTKPTKVSAQSFTSLRPL